MRNSTHYSTVEQQTTELFTPLTFGSKKSTWQNRSTTRCQATKLQSARPPQRQSARPPQRQSARPPQRQSTRPPQRQSARLRRLKKQLFYRTWITMIQLSNCFERPKPDQEMWL